MGKAKQLLKHGDTFTVDGHDFQVTTISSIDDGNGTVTGYIYEVMLKSLADERSVADEASAAEEVKAHNEAINEAAVASQPK